MSNDLDALRNQIQALDEQLVQLIAERTRLSKQVAAAKFETGGEILNRAVFDEKMKKLTKLGKSLGLPAKTVRRLWRGIHHESIRIQKLELKRLNRNKEIE